MESGLVGLDDDAGDDERRAAELEEVIGGAHTVHLQDAGEDVAEGTLSVVLRCLVVATDGQLRFGQSLDVGLAVGCHRHLLQLQIGRRHHILRETLADFLLQSSWCNLTAGSIVGTEVLLPAELADEDDYLLHAVHLKHHVFNLAQLNAQTAQLDLVVGATEDDDIAVGQPLGIVARLIDALTMIVNETLTRHLVEVVIATGHTATTDVEFANHAYGQFVAVAVDDELLDIQLGLADGDDLGIGQFGIVGGHGDFRRTVAVEDAGLGDASHLREQGIAELLTAGTANLDLTDGLAEVFTGEPRLPT